MAQQDQHLGRCMKCRKVWRNKARHNEPDDPRLSQSCPVGDGTA
ncbi:hypothetical protein ACLB1Q_20955 [Escherichia coli]